MISIFAASVRLPDPCPPSTATAHTLVNCIAAIFSATQNSRYIRVAESIPRRIDLPPHSPPPPRRLLLPRVPAVDVEDADGEPDGDDGDDDAGDDDAEKSDFVDESGFFKQSGAETEDGQTEEKKRRER